MTVNVEQPVPNVSEADVKRIVSRDFGNEQEANVLSALERFDMSPRVRLALKLANGDFDKLLEAGKDAIQDYRNVLAWAEYPRSWMRSGSTVVRRRWNNLLLNLIGNNIKSGFNGPESSTCG
jgi:hypothetical protein